MKMKSTKGMLVSMIGIEYAALKKSSASNVIRFVGAAICVLVILLLSFISVYYAFELMFHMWYVQILLSLFFSFMFGIIYILLIQTFSKQPLAQKSRRRLNVSNILRGLFILFIGFLISKPIEIMILSGRLANDIEQYQAHLNLSFEKQVHAIYAGDISRLGSRLHTYKQMKGTVSGKDINAVSGQFNELKDKEQIAIRKAYDRINGSSFFLQRVRLVGRYPFSLVICVLIITLFFIPVALIYTVSSDNVYYIDKRKQEHALVLSHYLNFRKLYAQSFEQSFGLANITFYESHTDPPFRTQRIPAPECSTEEEFFNRFRGNGLPQRLL